MHLDALKLHDSMTSEAVDVCPGTAMSRDERVMLLYDIMTLRGQPHSLIH